MKVNEFKKYCQDVVQQHPELRADVIDLYTLAMDEIEDGGSPTHEIEMAVADIESMINKKLKPAVA